MIFNIIVSSQSKFPLIKHLAGEYDILDAEKYFITEKITFVFVNIK